MEFLVVITIIGILIALLCRRCSGPRSGAKGTMFQQHEADGLGPSSLPRSQGHVPPGYGLVNATEGWAWSAFILPYMEQANISDRIDYTHSFNEYVSPNNTLLKTILPFYQCPGAAPGGASPLLRRLRCP